MEDTRHWHALYTRYKSEKIAQKYFQHQGIEAYVPVLEKTKRYTRKIKHYQIPLISCYVFVRIEPSLHGTALQNPHVIQFVRNRDGIPTIPAAEIDLLKKITGELNDVSLVEQPVELGESVEIISGHLTGIKGKVIAHKNSKQMVVELLHVGVQLRIDIDPTHLRRIQQRALASS